MKYILYCRKSTESEDKQVQSIESQIIEMNRLAQRDGIVFDKVFTEKKSAKSPGRPFFNELIKYTEKNLSTIYAWKLDRLARNPKDGGELQWQLDQGQITEIRTFEKTYRNTAEDKFMMNLEFGMAKKYVDDLSVNVKRGIRTKLEKGEWPNCAPFGYKNNTITHLVEINKEQALHVVEMFKIYSAGGCGIRELSKLMYEKGMKTKAGAKMGKTKIHIILTSPFYYGMMVKDGKFYVGKHQPLITKEIFDTVQDIISGRYKSRPKQRFFAYRGFMNCNLCSCFLTATLKKGHSYYYCTNGKGGCEQHKDYMRSEVANSMMAKVLGDIEFEEEDVEIMYQAAKEKIGLTKQYSDSATRTTTEKLVEAQEKQERLFNSYLNGSTPEALYKSKIQAIGNDIVNLEEQIKKLRVQETKESSTLELTKEYFLTASRAKKEFLKKDDTGKREVVEKILWNLSIKDKDLASYKLKEPYHFMVGALQNCESGDWRVGRDSKQIRAVSESPY
jgi:site-specific DNA recombinase